LNPTELRKAIKLATLVSLYNAGIIDFEVQLRRSIFRKREDLVIKLIKHVDQPDFKIERDLIALLKEKGKLMLKFSIPKIYGFGFDEKKWMDFNAELMNKELAEKGYLKEVTEKYEPKHYILNENAIRTLEHSAMEIKEKLSEFKEKRKDIWEKLYANL
jgi:hypothetical protein